ncbi:cytochrome ubiquinol oxidase subunit I [Weissella viridescens]|uniref:cytochrome ubiquinol oxidase subunit I n=1 Tax=Weissella viridescens TaxID=1629 RepID=UPI000AC55D02|nr:cytochrome ubiquinol oxidase subunit I [Weissella viridescens]
MDLITGLTMLDLSRFQFAMTTIFHFFFVPLSIGLGIMVAIMETMYVVKGDDVYKRMTKFWGRIFLLSFAVGVVTGIIQEFQFGMNWSRYSRYVGDIFGPALAVEALVAFFCESTFLGLWMFGWDRFKKGVHLLFIWLVAIGSAFSALWILAANSFMQNPVGFKIDHKFGRAVLVDFPALLTNHQLWLEFPHVLFATMLIGPFVIIGISAFSLLRRKDNIDFFKKSVHIASAVALVGTLGILITGDSHAYNVQFDQPMKFAAMEGISEDVGGKDKQQPWSVVAYTNPKTHETEWSLDVPYLLSVLAHHDLTGYNKGSETINKELHEKYDKKFGKDMNYYVPSNTLFYAFRVMAGVAGVLGLLAAVAWWFTRAKSTFDITKYRWVLWIFGIATFIPFFGTTAGWLITELGRYPWIVYGVLTIADAVSPNVSFASLFISNIIYFLTFTALGGVMIYLSRRVMIQGPDYVDEEVDDEQAPADPFSADSFDEKGGSD